MTRARLALFAFLSALACMLTAYPASATHKPPAAADVAVQESMRGGLHAFCTNPPKSLEDADVELCPLARETAGCEKLAALCDHVKATVPENKPAPESPRLPSFVGGIARVATVLVVVAVILALLVPILLAFLRSRRDGTLRDLTPDAPIVPNAARPEERGPVITDAERLLALANDLAARGELKEALGTYLTASLRALDHRGLIRFARHRTNGEYVRSCTDPNARTELSAVVREVEEAEFGGHEPSAEAVAHVQRSATSLVRAAMLAASVMLLALLSMGCGGTGALRAENEPAGKQLLIDVLQHQGLTARYLAGSIGSLPIPGEDDLAPVVVLDLSITKLDDDARSHLLHWVRAGGVLIALAPHADMEDLLAVESLSSSERDVTVLLDDPYQHELYAYQAKVAHGRKLRLRDRKESKESRESREPSAPEAPNAELTRDVVATVGLSEDADEDDAYAIEESLGHGAIVTVATADLFTNVGISHGENAKATMALFERAFGAAHDGNLATYHERPIEIARATSGMTPPGNPMSAISQAGLGLGMWHALAAALVLFFAVGVRQARARPSPPPARRAFAEHVEATGALYAKARAASHARAVLAKYTDERVRQKSPQRQAREADDDAFARLTGKSPAEYKYLVADSSTSEMGELHRMRELRRVLARISPPVPSHSHPEEKDPS